MTSTSIYQEPVLSYVYRLDHPTTKEFYFGFRKANIVPASQDLGIEYFTSSEYVEPRFHEFNYTIIQEFVDPLDAYDLEQFLIYQELKNPLILNRRCHHGKEKQFTFSGKNHSQETKTKISAARKGVSKKPQTEEHKAKLSASLKGIPQSAESNAKRSATMTGVPRSEETKTKISAARKGILKPKFFSIIETRKTYDKGNLSKHHPEFKQYY